MLRLIVPVDSALELFYAFTVRLICGTLYRCYVYLDDLILRLPVCGCHIYTRYTGYALPLVVAYALRLRIYVYVWVAVWLHAFTFTHVYGYVCLLLYSFVTTYIIYYYLPFTCRRASLFSPLMPLPAVADLYYCSLTPVRLVILPSLLLDSI